MDKRLKSEIWETQVILYWILSVLLFQNHHVGLGYASLVWGIFTLGGALVLNSQAKLE